MMMVQMKMMMSEMSMMMITNIMVAMTTKMMLARMIYLHSADHWGGRAE